MSEDQMKYCRSFFLTQLKSMAPVGHDTAVCLFSALKILNVNKRGMLCQRGQRLDKVFFVATGLVESYYVSENGKKVIDKIYKAGDFIFDYSSNLDESTTQMNYKTINDCQLIYFTFDELQQIVSENPELWNHAIKIIMGELLAQQQRNINSRSLDTLTRFQCFLKEFEGFTQQISNKKVSEYLGVTEQGLHKAKQKSQPQKSHSCEGTNGALDIYFSDH